MCILITKSKHQKIKHNLNRFQNIFFTLTSPGVNLALPLRNDVCVWRDLLGAAPKVCIPDPVLATPTLEDLQTCLPTQDQRERWEDMSWTHCQIKKHKKGSSNLVEIQLHFFGQIFFFSFFDTDPRNPIFCKTAMCLFIFNMDGGDCLQNAI